LSLLFDENEKDQWGKYLIWLIISKIEKI
jgi:hypothetical protein